MKACLFLGMTSLLLTLTLWACSRNHIPDFAYICPFLVATLLNESRLSLTEAAQKLGVNTTTIWRWVLRGVRGVKLSSISIGAKRYTSEEAVERFVEATTRAANGDSALPRPRTSRQRSAEIERRTRECEEEGI